MDRVSSADSPAALAARPPALRGAPELSIVVPTFNERANVPLLVERLARVLNGIDWEVLFVDDNSPDGTAAVVRGIGETDSRVRCLHRIGRRGLAGACLEGMLASQARYLAVMDGDLQHDERSLIGMLKVLRAGHCDLAVASRYLDGGSAPGLSKRRARLTHWSIMLVQRLLGIAQNDPLSGFFMIRRDAFTPIASSISSEGFKILLDILATKPARLRVVELPATLSQRRYGESKLDLKIALDFAALLTTKLTNGAVSGRFLLFCLVGSSGLAVHLGVLSVAAKLAGLAFGAAQTLATLSAITWNFVFNNFFTYHDQRLTGWRFATGLLRFLVICAIGALSNVGIAAWIYQYDSRWWLAGLGGALIGTVWNFVVSAAFVWWRR